jgi:hypothetical protein
MAFAIGSWHAAILDGKNAVLRCSFNNDILRGLLRQKPDLTSCVHRMPAFRALAIPFSWSGLLKKAAFFFPMMFPQ